MSLTIKKAIITKGVNDFQLIHQPIKRTFQVQQM